NNLRLIMMRVYAFVARTRKPARRVLSTMVARLGLERNLRGCQSHRPEHMQRAATSRQSYTRAIFRTHAHLADEAAEILVAGGALGCAVAGMKLPRAREDKTVALEAYFDRISAAELSRLKLMMEQAGMLADAAHDGTAGGGARNGSVRRIVDPGWSTLWMRRFGPFRVGRRMLIVPPWKRENQPGRTTIVVQPARAFGTGHHPTTAGALRALESLIVARAPRSILDAGTGSGVLAIAA